VTPEQQKLLVAGSSYYPTMVEKVFGWTPRPWQRDLLTAPREVHDEVMNFSLAAHRQAGKSETTVALAACVALDPRYAGEDSLIVSTGRDHAQDVLRRCAANLEAAQAVGIAEIAEQSKHHIKLKSGSRIVSVASTPSAVRGWVIGGIAIADEAGWQESEVLQALFPTTASARGQIVLLSTPNGRRGVYAETHLGDQDGWHRITFPASHPDCHLSQAYLDQQRQILGATMYAQEYLCSFVDRSTAAFDTDAIAAAFGGGNVVLPPDDAVPVETVIRSTPAFPTVR